MVLDANNNPITFQADTPYGTVDRTSTDATTIGSSVQATNNAKLFDHGNYFSAGGSIDHSRVGFGANSELGYIFPDLSVGPNATLAGCSVIHTLANIGYSPLGLDARSTYYGLYVTDVFDITSRLSANAGARLNVAKIGMSDLLGTSPDLNGNYTFTRLNPMAAFRIKRQTILRLTAATRSLTAPQRHLNWLRQPSKPCLLEGFQFLIRSAGLPRSVGLAERRIERWPDRVESRVVPHRQRR